MSVFPRVEYESAREDRKLELPYCIGTYEQGFDQGFKYALEMFGIWKDGSRTIGCQNTPIREIFKSIGLE